MEQGEVKGMRADREALGVWVADEAAESGSEVFEGWSVRQVQGIVLKACDLPSFLTFAF